MPSNNSKYSEEMREETAKKVSKEFGTFRYKIKYECPWMSL